MKKVAVVLVLAIVTILLIGRATIRHARLTAKQMERKLSETVNECSICLSPLNVSQDYKG